MFLSYIAIFFNMTMVAGGSDLSLYSELQGHMHILNEIGSKIKSRLIQHPRQLAVV